MKRKMAFRCTIMRGGTSKGIFLMEKDLPQDLELKDRIILAIFGSPDIRQIDGLGGADSLTSKLAIISPSQEPDRDVNYTFGAVGIDKPFVDYSANCGNISSAVGPFAIERGLVPLEEPFTTVKIFNTNSRRMIHSKVPVKKRKVVYEGDYEIAGVPSTGAKIELSFMAPGGGVTGSLLPTGNAMDEVTLDTGERFRVTIVDAGNLTAFIRASEFGFQGTELPAFFEQDAKFKIKFEAIRNKLGDLIGIPTTPSIPKIVFIGPSQDFKTITGKEVNKNEIDLVGRAVAMGKIHKAFPVTGGVPAAAASAIPGSTLHEVATGSENSSADGRRLVIGHPSGKFDVEVKAKQEGDQVHILSCTVGRTARKIMEGRVYIPKKIYQIKS